MKFSCAKDAIYNAVTAASKAAAIKTTISALEGLLLELEGNILSITGYNFEIGIRTSVEVEDPEDGSAVVNAKMFVSVIKGMRTGIVDFEFRNNCAYVKQGDTNLMVVGMDANDYPPVPQPNEGEGFNIPRKTLKSMIMQTKYACAVVDTKPVLTGCLFDIEDNTLNVVAVDGIRIALRQEPLVCENSRFIVPAKTLEELIHLLGDEEDKFVNICVDMNQISFRIDNYTMISRLISGDFLEYKKHLNMSGSIFAEINCREIIEILERATLFINDKTKSVPLRCEFSGDSLSISCSTALGKIDDKISIKYNGAPIAIGFNVRFLLDAFKAADTDCVKLLMDQSASAPVMIVPVEGSEFKFFLLPMRMK